LTVNVIEHRGADPEAALLDPEFARDPYPLYEQLLDGRQVYWSPGLQYWFVSGYEENKQLMLDPRHYANGGWDDVYMAQLPPGSQAGLPHLLAHFATPSLVGADPPAHTRLRRLVHRAFTPAAVARLQTAIEQAVDGLLDAGARNGRLDVLRDLGVPLPVGIFAHMFGLPPSAHEMLKGTSADFTRFISNVRPDLDQARDANASLGAFRAYLRDVFAARRASPADDLATVLVAPDASGDVLGDEELLSLCAHLLIAGHETTTNLIANGTLALLTHPDQLAALRADPSLAPAAVEEVMRWETPLQRVKRMTTEPVELNGHTIEQGERLMLLIGAANRDPRTYDDPEAFDFLRPRAPHLAFGHGIHFCVGAALARLEGQVALTRLVTRFDRLRLEDGWQPTWNPSLLRGLVELPVLV
jgi:cytochrome P450